MVAAIAVILNFIIFFLAVFLILKSTDVFVKGAVEVSVTPHCQKSLWEPHYAVPEKDLRDVYNEVEF